MGEEGHPAFCPSLIRGATNYDFQYCPYCDGASLMANGRHSYVRFFPSDWVGGTARLPRLHRSVYFDICCYIWDTAEAVPNRELRLMVADLPNGEEIVSDLIEIGKITRQEDGSITNSKAMTEAEWAFGQWVKRSSGGKTSRMNAEKSAAESAAESDDADMGSNNQNQNQNQNQTSPNGDDGARGRRKWVDRPDDVDPEVWKAFRDHRKTPCTSIALAGFEREAAKAGWTLQAAIVEAIERGWQGFKAEWVKGGENGKRSGWRP